MQQSVRSNQCMLLLVMESWRGVNKVEEENRTILFKTETELLLTMPKHIFKLMIFCLQFNIHWREIRKYKKNIKPLLPPHHPETINANIFYFLATIFRKLGVRIYAVLYGTS